MEQNPNIPPIIIFPVTGKEPIPATSPVASVRDKNGEYKKILPRKKNKNFPKRGPRPHKVGILPAHRVIFDNYREQGFRNLGQAIRRTGVYSEGVARRVHILTKSKSWKMLMQEFMPEHHLALRHSELLDKRDTQTVVDSKYGPDGKLVGTVTTVLDMGPETAAVTKGLEMAYKLRGSFKEPDAPKATTVMYNLFYKPEVREQMRVFEEGIKKTLFNEINKRNVADTLAEEENKSNLEQSGSGEHTATVEGGDSGNDTGGNTS